jgi:hypothetical protein
VEETKDTDFAAFEPNLTVEVAVKFAPLIVTVLAPVLGPAFGDTLVTVPAGATVVEVIPGPQPLFDPPFVASPP